MLDSAPFHPKMKRLSRLLKIPLPYAVGVMELLWIYTKEHCPAGDIGRAEDIDIEDACGWPEERSGELIPALVEAKWLDRSTGHRLLVHDWADHGGPYVNAKLFRMRRLFATGQVPKCRQQDLKEPERKPYADWVLSLSQSPMDKPEESNGQNAESSGDLKLIEVKLLEVKRSESAGQDLPTPDQNPEPEPPAPPPPSKKPSLVPEKPGGLTRVRREDMPRIPGVDPKARSEIASILEDWREERPRLGPVDGQLVGMVAKALHAAGWTPSELIELLRGKRETIRRANSWGLVIMIIEAACRGSTSAVPKVSPEGRRLDA